MSIPPERKPRSPANVLLTLLGPLDGARIPGGCDECDAFQTATPIEAMAWSVTVHHDDWCPWYAARHGGAPS